MFGGGEWDLLTLEAVLPDGRGLTQRKSLLEPPQQQGALHCYGSLHFYFNAKEMGTVGAKCALLRLAHLMSDTLPLCVFKHHFDLC